MLKYVVYLCVIYFVIAWVFSVGKTTPTALIAEVMSSTRGQLLLVAILVLSVIYPWTGFVKKRVAGLLSAVAVPVEEILGEAGFVPVSPGIYRAKSPVRRFMMMYEDEILVRQEGDFIVVEGQRRTVSRLVLSVQSEIERLQRNA